MEFIINSILDGLVWLVRGMTGWIYNLPDATLPAGLVNSVVTITQSFRLINFIVPIDTIFDCLTVVFVYLTGVVIYKFVRFGMKFIPFIG